MGFFVIQVIDEGIFLELSLNLILKIHSQQLVFISGFQKRLKKKLFLLLQFELVFGFLLLEERELRLFLL